MESLYERLFSKIKINAETGCWEWTATKVGKGYGWFWVDGASRLAHRVSYKIHCGQIPEGMHVCHSCDNRGCVNPNHLFLGTHPENMSDRNAKGRQARPMGIKNGHAKLTDADVRAIRSATGISQSKLAKQYNVSQSRISYIKTGRNWTHI